MAKNNIEVALIGTDKSLSRSMNTAGRNMDRLATKMKDAGRTMTMGLTLPIVAGAAVAVKAASDLNESMNKTNVVFGKAAASVHKWSSTSATAFGLSRQAAEDAAATIGNLFTTMGLGEKQTARMSTRIVELAADLASFNNIPIEEALTSLRSGLVGEAEPMRRLGVLLSEAAVQAKAVEMGYGKVSKESAKYKSAAAALTVAQEKYNAVMKDGEATVGQKAAAEAALARAEEQMTAAVKGSGAQLTEQQKVMARYRLIIEQTGKAQGDFQRTSDGLANRMRILKAQLTDIAAKMGTELLPVVERAAEYITKMTAAFNGLSDSKRKSIVRLGLFVAALGPTIWVVAEAIKVVEGLWKAYQQLAKWAGLAAAAQKVAGASSLSGAAGAGAAGAGAAGTGGAIAAAAVVPVAIVAIAAAAAGALILANKRAAAATAGNAPGNTFGLGPGAAERAKTYTALSERLTTLQNKLSVQMALGVDTSATEKSIARTQQALDQLRRNFAKDIRAGHVNTSYWEQAFSDGEDALRAFRSHVSAGINTGPLNTSSWTTAMWNAYRIYLNIKKGMGAPVSSHTTPGPAPAHKPATKPRDGDDANGGIYSSPRVTLVGEAGPEAIIPLTRPARAAQLMEQAGLVGAGGYGNININVVVPAGTTLVGTAREVGEVLAPHVARALGREAARAGRRR